MTFRFLSHFGPPGQLFLDSLHSGAAGGVAGLLGARGQFICEHLQRLSGCTGTLLGWNSCGQRHGEGHDLSEGRCRIRFDSGEMQVLPTEDVWILSSTSTDSEVKVGLQRKSSVDADLLDADPELKWAIAVSMQEVVPIQDFMPQKRTQRTQGEKLLSDQVEELDLAYVALCTENWAEDRLLGAGACGKVYKGIHRDDGGEAARFAVKRQWCPDDDIEARQRLERMNRAEIDTLTRIKHPNIIRLLGYSKGQEDMVLIYEFGEQGSLENALQEDALAAKLDWALRIRIAHGILAGVRHLHEQQLYHRDVKPGNIVLMEDFTPKLNDFGLSKSFREAECADEVPEGTPEFMCQQYVNTHKFDEKSEVYAIGVTLLQLSGTSIPTLLSRRCYSAHIQYMTHICFIHSLPRIVTGSTDLQSGNPALIDLLDEIDQDAANGRTSACQARDRRPDFEDNLLPVVEALSDMAVHLG